MMDVIFISPLGWSRHVWDKVITDERFGHKSYEVIEFLNTSFEEISVASIEKTINDSLGKLAPDGLVITASYGTAALTAFLKKQAVSLERLLVIDGLDRLPSAEELAAMFVSVEDKTYQTVADYYEDMLSADERDDGELLAILAANLIKRNGAYFPSLDIKGTKAYLSLYADLDVAKEFGAIWGQIKNLAVFSSRSVNFPHIPIREEDHLLMLKDPQQVFEKIFGVLEGSAK